MKMKFSMDKLKYFLLLQFLVLLYSIFSLLSKCAAQQQLFSYKFFLLYSPALLIMLIYAFFWQRVIKKLPLSIAFSNKAVIIVWGLLWGSIFFSETINLPKIIGSILVMAGIIVVVSKNE